MEQEKYKETIMDEDTRILLYMFHLALLEIRASNDVTVCRAFAGVFHNVPIHILSGIDKEEIYSGIFDTADRVGIPKSIIENLKENATKRVS